MKLIVDNNKFIVFLNKDENIDFDNKTKMEKYFKDLFSKIKNKYNVDISGYYNIDIYIDKYYGSIIEIEDEQLDYYTYFNQIDMEINVLKNSLFLYEIGYEFLDKKILDKVICYKINDKIYFQIISDIDDLLLAKIIEYGHILYGKEVDKIVKQGKKVKLWKNLS